MFIMVGSFSNHTKWYFIKFWVLIMMFGILPWSTSTIRWWTDGRFTLSSIWWRWHPKNGRLSLKARSEPLHWVPIKNQTLYFCSFFFIFIIITVLCCRIFWGCLTYDVTFKLENKSNQTRDLLTRKRRAELLIDTDISIEFPSFQSA